VNAILEAVRVYRYRRMKEAAKAGPVPDADPLAATF